MKQWLITTCAGVMWTEGEFTVGCRWEEAFEGLRRGKQSSLAGVESTSHECSENTQHRTKKKWFNSELTHELVWRQKIWRSEEAHHELLPGTLHRAGPILTLWPASLAVMMATLLHDSHTYLTRGGLNAISGLITNEGGELKRLNSSTVSESWTIRLTLTSVSECFLWPARCTAASGEKLWCDSFIKVKKAHYNTDALGESIDQEKPWSEINQICLLAATLSWPVPLHDDTFHPPAQKWKSQMFQKCHKSPQWKEVSRVSAEVCVLFKCQCIDL